MIYELRVYHCVPGRLPDLNKRFENFTLKMWAQRGICPVGFWTVLVGENNQDLIYMLAWNDMAERERVFGAFMTDPEWLKIRAETEKKGPIVASVSNSFLAPTAYSKLK